MHDIAALQEAIVDEQIADIFDPLDYADELEEMWSIGLDPGLSTGFHGLDALYKVKTGQWTVITGTPGAGKSTFIDNVMVNMSRLHGWKHLICSPENQPIKRHIANLVSIYTGKQFRSAVLAQEEMQQAMVWVRKHFRFIHPPEKNFTLEVILDKAEALLDSGFDFKGFVLDPWNELEHRRPAGWSETEYVSWMLSRMRRFARDKDIHKWLVAHPTKLQKIQSRDGDERTRYPIPSLYDIAGSAHFNNKADMGIVVYRDMSIPNALTQIHVQKVRFRESGQLGATELKFEWYSGRFEDAVR